MRADQDPWRFRWRRAGEIQTGFERCEELCAEHAFNAQVAHILTDYEAELILAEANHVVHEGKLKKGSIVRLKSYQANAVKGKRYVEESRSACWKLIIVGF